MHRKRAKIPAKERKRNDLSIGDFETTEAPQQLEADYRENRVNRTLETTAVLLKNLLGEKTYYMKFKRLEIHDDVNMCGPDLYHKIDEQFRNLGVKIYVIKLVMTSSSMLDAKAWFSVDFSQSKLFKVSS